MERVEIEQKISEFLRQEKTLPEGAIDPNAVLADLGFDSLDAINIIFKIEDAFRISISDEDARAIRTLNDMVAVVERIRSE
jgi:acyl carrier protein